MNEKPTDDMLWNKFQHHAPHGDQCERYAKIRLAAFEFAKAIRDATPASSEQTRAINEVHMAMMLANAAIALNEQA